MSKKTTYSVGSGLVNIISQRLLEVDGAGLLNDVEVVQGCVTDGSADRQQAVAEVILQETNVIKSLGNIYLRINYYKTNLTGNI